jgi:transcriptional regulator with GAF, ATPase, and Fis domain
LSAELRQRYEEANRLASRFCQQLERRFLRRQRFHPEAWLRTLREFYRRPHHQKLRYALR